MPAESSRGDHEIIQLQFNEDQPDARQSRSKPRIVKPQNQDCCSRFHTWIANLLLSDDKDKQDYLSHYTCKLPPMFILLVSLAELVVFMYYIVKAERKQWITLDSGLLKTPLIYDPYKREQAWRFVSYMFLHAGLEHIVGNLLLQISIGVLLEMVHNGFRVCIVYMSGVLAGSLASSMFDPFIYLVGASGGVYALIGGFFANIVMNWNKMALNGLHLFLFLLIVMFDLGFSIYRRVIVFPNGPPKVSLTAHVAGGLAGITIGYVVFSNYKKSLFSDPKWVACLLSYFMCVAVAIFWNLFLTPVGTIV